MRYLGLDTELLMSDGSTKNVQDIIIGDKLRGSENNEVLVKSINNKFGKLYKVHYFDDSFYIIGEEHTLTLVRSKTNKLQKMGKKVLVNINEYLLWNKEKKRIHIGYKKSVEYDNNDTIITPYLLGLWLGDGHSTTGCITNMDEAIIKYLKEYGVKNIRKSHPNDKAFLIQVNGLTTLLRSENLIKNKHIPNDYLINSKENRLKLLAGLLDTDGNLEKSKRNFSIMQKNKILSYQILRLAQSVGLHATIKKVKKHCYYKGEKREGDYYRINISRNIEIVPVKIERKIPVSGLHQQRNNLHFGFKFEEIENGVSYGIDTGNYLCLLSDYTCV